MLIATLLSSQAGAAGLPFLRLAAGARASALAEASTALTDVDAMAANPAAVSARRGRLSLTHSSWIQQIQHDNLTAVVARRNSAFALQVLVSQADQLERRVGPTPEPLGEFGVYEWALGLGYTRRADSGLRLGAAAKLIRQSIDAEAAAGAALDVGLLLPLTASVDVGVAVRNLGAMNSLAQKATGLPQQVRGGVAWTRSGQVGAADVRWTRGGEVSVGAGLERYLAPSLVARVGYQTSDTRSFSAGLGVTAKGWRVDYAYVPFGSDLGQAHRISLFLGPSGRAAVAGGAGRL